METPGFYQKLKKHGIVSSVIYQAWRFLNHPKYGISKKNRHRLVDHTSRTFSALGVKKINVRVNGQDLFVAPTCPWAINSFVVVPRYDSEEIQSVAECVLGDFIFLDIGANFGVWTFSLAQHFKQVVAFEPDARCYYCLTETLKARQAAHVSIFNMGLSNFDGNGQLFVAEGHSGDGRIYNPQEDQRNSSKPIEVRKLDTVLLELGLQGEKKYFIKMDVQGSEPSVLEGASKAISEAQDIILFTEIHPILGSAGSSIEDYLQLLFRLGLEPIELKNGKIIPSSMNSVRQYLEMGHKDFFFRKQSRQK